MLAKAAVKLCSLFRAEAKLGLALRVVQTLPESHGDLSSFAGRELEERGQCIRAHELILSHLDHVGKQ
jgi:hypothetical protein